MWINTLTANVIYKTHGETATYIKMICLWFLFRPQVGADHALILASTAATPVTYPKLALPPSHMPISVPAAGTAFATPPDDAWVWFGFISLLFL